MATPELEDLITANRTHAALLGWNPTDVGALTFDPLLVSMVKAQQHLLGIPDAQCDGILGPKTYALLLDAKIEYITKHPRAPNSQMSREQALDANLADQGVLAVYEIKKLWLTKVLDLPDPNSADYARCQDLIDRLIRTELGLDWSWESEYRQNKFKWCGSGPAYGYRKGIAAATRQKWFASNYRFDRFFHYQPMDATPNPKPATGPYRMVLELDEGSTGKDCVFADGSKPRAGDIALIGPHGTAYGMHITTIEQYIETPRSTTITTLEHNGTGYWPDGTRRHGIIRAVRAIGAAVPETTQYIVRRIGRLAPHDFSIPLLPRV